MKRLLMLALLFVGVAAAQETECEAGFRLLEHELLATDPICIPENPERVVVTAPRHIVALLRAKVPIVGIAAKDFVIEQFPEWEAELVEIPEIGFPPNLEQVLEVDPDLIIVPDETGEDPQPLTDIAPTVVAEFPGTHVWRENAELVFDAVGELEAYEALMSELDARTTGLGEALGDEAAQEISIVRIVPDRVILYSQYSPGSQIAEEVGFSRPDSQRLPVTPEEFNANPDNYPSFSVAYSREISFETLDQADGDFIVIFGNFSSDADAQATVDNLSENPLWQTLNAVQEGDVHVTSVNYAGPDIDAVHFVLDDLAEAFGIADEFSSNPYEVRADIPNE